MRGKLQPLPGQKHQTRKKWKTRFCKDAARRRACVLRKCLPRRKARSPGRVWTALGTASATSQQCAKQNPPSLPAKHLECLPALPRDFLSAKPQTDPQADPKPKPTLNRQQTNSKPTHKQTPTERFRVFFCHRKLREVGFLPQKRDF